MGVAEMVLTLFWRAGQGLGSRAASLDEEEVVLSLHCGETSPKLELTRGQLRSMTLERMTEIWKVRAALRGVPSSKACKPHLWQLGLCLQIPRQPACGHHFTVCHT
jgi:hypothetical protein